MAVSGGIGLAGAKDRKVAKGEAGAKRRRWTVKVMWACEVMGQACVDQVVYQAVWFVSGRREMTDGDRDKDGSRSRPGSWRAGDLKVSSTVCGTRAPDMSELCWIIDIRQLQARWREMTCVAVND